MSPDNIMRSDVLDIVFENRNKDYGAYALRKYYYRRLRAALIAVSLLTVLLAFVNSIKPKPTIVTEYFFGDIDTIKPLPPPEEPKEPEPSKQQLKPVASVDYQTPVIAPDDQVTDTIPNMEVIEKSAVSDLNSEGEPVINELITEQKIPPGTATVQTEPVKISIPEVLEIAEKMPAYPGGMEALKKYMMKNLMQPDDLEEGQKIIVVAKFIVREDGSIDEASIAKTGRSDLDREVLRVVRKMPHWEPGKQNGRQVSVWFQIPVTFVSEN